MSEVLDLARDLIARPSVTPDDAGCQPLVAERLRRAGFACEHLRFGEVDNLWATHGPGDPVLVLLGPTDVVPPGPPEASATDPFVPAIRARVPHGRGAADLQGRPAAFVLPPARLVAPPPRHPATAAPPLPSAAAGTATPRAPH